MQRGVVWQLQGSGGREKNGKKGKTRDSGELESGERGRLLKRVFQRVLS